MKPESLQALIIDQHAGELTPDVADLLDAYLASNPAAQEEAARILDALSLTSQAVVQHPELARVSTRATHAVPRTRQRWTPPLWLKAAAVVMLAALTAMAGFWVGRAQPVSGAGSSAIASTAPVSPRKDSPWAKYRMGPDPLGNGIRVVRVDTMEQEVRP